VTSDLERAASRWLDRFFDAYYRRRPVNATFIGIHDHDSVLPDCSENAAGDTVAEMESLFRDGAALEIGQLTDPNRTDLQVALGYLLTQLWEYRSSHGYRGNPSWYVGEAIFGVFSLLLTDFGPLAERLDRAAARLEATPALLDQARHHVRSAPLPWTERAIRECQGALALLRDGVAHLPNRTGRFDHAVALAATAFETHRHHLTTELSTQATDAIAAGEEALALHLAEAHFLDESVEELVGWAREELAVAEGRLAGKAQGAGRKAQEAGRGAEHGVGRYQVVWDEARRWAVEHRLVTWPDFPIRYVARPAWARLAAPHLYFLFYRSPAAFGRPAVHEYLVPDDDPGETAIKLNHVVHHGGIGHHVQNWHAFRAESRIGRIAAVDCASRIALLAGGTMAEGWACYATDLMDEIGYLTPDEQLDEIHTRRRMCARAVVDLELHRGRMSYPEAVEFYQARAGMPRNAAAAEATKNSMFPGGAVMYLVGQDAIHRLRRHLSARSGPRFDLGAFHDRFLSFGSLPVTLIAERMRREAEHAV
jgi:hypothetical protein